MDEVLKEQTGIAVVNDIRGGARAVGVQMEGFGSEALGGAINILTRHGAIQPQALASLRYGSLNITDVTLEGETPFHHQRGSANISANYYRTDGFNNDPNFMSGVPPHRLMMTIQCRTLTEVSVLP